MTGTLTIPQELEDELNVLLREKYPGVEVVRVARDVLEVRYSEQDGLNSLFPVGLEPENRETPTIEGKPAEKRPEAPEMGFAGICLQTDFSGLLTQAQTDRLSGIIGGHLDILSRTKPGCGVWNNLLREISRVADGTFASSHPWNRAWLSKAEKQGFPPDALDLHSIDEVLEALEDCLAWIDERVEQGWGYWWIGKSGKRSLLDFIASRNREGSYISPFCEAWVISTGWKTRRESVPVFVAEEVDRMLRGLRVDDRELSRIWGGVKTLVDWYYRNQEALAGASMANRIRLADGRAFVRLLGDWFSTLRGLKTSPFAWLRVGTEAWVNFTTWAKSEHGVIIPGGCR